MWRARCPILIKHTRTVNIQRLITTQEPPTNTFDGELVAVSNRDVNVPFSKLAESGSREIDQFMIVPQPDDLDETYTLYGNSGSTYVVFQIPPFFTVQPQGQSVFVGSNVTFAAQAIHTTGYQWQKDGTNLVENSHFVGVTNTALTIVSPGLEDAGTYEIVAEHPTSPVTNSEAVLSVFKPIQLSLSQPAAGIVRLTASNADKTPFEAQRLSKVAFYSAPDPGRILTLPP